MAHLQQLLILLLLFGSAPARAGMDSALQARGTAEADAAFARGTLELQNVTGAFFFFDTTRNHRPSVDFAINSLRLGTMLSSPAGPGLLRGNLEFLGEAFAGGIFTGPGHVLAGATMLLRYNLVQPGARLVPYGQVGAGLVYTDIPEGASGGLISLPVEFNLQASLGARWMLDRTWSLVGEVTYRHISNATIRLPNYGIDSLGGSLGFGRSF